MVDKRWWNILLVREKVVEHLSGEGRGGGAP